MRTEPSFLSNQPAFRVEPTVGPLSVSDRSKCYFVLLKMPRKLLTLRSLQTCQASDVEFAGSPSVP